MLRDDPELDDWFRENGLACFDYTSAPTLRKAKINVKKLTSEPNFDFVRRVGEICTGEPTKMQAQSFLKEKLDNHHTTWKLKEKHHEAWLEKNTFRWRNMVHHVMTASNATRKPKWFIDNFTEDVFDSEEKEGSGS